MYGSNKKDIVEIVKKLCEMKGVQLIEGKVCVDHVYMYVAITPKMIVSEFMSYLKGESALMFYDRHLWAQRYYVALGNVNEETIQKYIQKQEENDKLEGGSK